MNLRDQILKSGLATKEQAKRAERAVSKVQHKKAVEARSQNSDKVLTEAEQIAKKTAEIEAAEAEKRAKEKDRFVAEQMTIDIIKRGAMNDPLAKDSYYFTMPDGQIAKMLVNEWQTMQLAAGVLAIAYLEVESRFVIISQANAEKVEFYDPRAIVCFHKTKRPS